MKFFFDNNLSPHLAHGIRELSAINAKVDEVIHLSDRFDRNAPDLIWIGELSNDGPWYIISIDRFKKQHGAEREAIRRAGHTVFILDGQWSKHSFWLQSERLVRWWPQVIASSAMVSLKIQDGSRITICSRLSDRRARYREDGWGVGEAEAVSSLMAELTSSCRFAQKPRRFGLGLFKLPN